MRRMLPASVLLLALVFTLLGGRTAAQPGGSSPIYLPLVMRSSALAPSLNLPVTAATYLGGAGADGANAVDVAPDGAVVLGATLPGHNPGGVTPTVLPGGSSGAVLRLTRDGKTVLSITRIGSAVSDLEISNSGVIAVCGDFGVAALDPSASAARWSAAPGAVSRCAIGNDGTVAALAGGTVLIYNDSGALRKSWSIAGTTGDIAVDGANAQVIATGFNQVSGNLQIPFIRAWGYDGAPRWKSYDFAAGTPNLGSADTRGERIAVGRDGKLYFAASINGGTGASVLARDPQDPSKSAGDRTVVTDKYNNPYNIGSVKMAWFGRFSPQSGALELAQSLLTRLSSDKGNSIAIRAITADEEGRVYLAGDSSCCLDRRDSRQVAGITVGSYEGGEAFFLAVSADFQERLIWTPFAAPGASAGGSPASGVGTRGGVVAVAATLNASTSGGRALVTASALQAAPATLPDAYLAVWWPLN